MAEGFPVPRSERDDIARFVDEMRAQEQYLFEHADETLAMLHAAERAADVGMPSASAARTGAAIVEIVGADRVEAEHRRLRGPNPNRVNPTKRAAVVRATRRRG